MEKAVLLEAPYALKHTMPVDALRENCQSSSPQLCFRYKYQPRDKPPHPAAPNNKPACPETHTTSPMGNQPKIAANTPVVCIKQAKWTSKPSDVHTKTCASASSSSRITMTSSPNRSTQSEGGNNLSSTENNLYSKINKSIDKETQQKPRSDSETEHYILYVLFLRSFRF